METLTTLKSRLLRQVRSTTTVNYASRSASIRRLPVAFGRCLGFGLLIGTCAFAQPTATAPTSSASPSSAAPASAEEDEATDAMRGRALFEPVTMTSRAVYREETQVIAEPANVWAPPLTDGQVFRTGQITIRPALRYLYLYGDGMLSRPGVEENSSIHALSPTIAVGIGEVWTFSYAPVWTMYSSDAFSDTINHRAQLRGQTQFEAWNLSASQSYTRNRSPLAETGSQTEVERFLTRLQGSYDLNSRTRVQGNVEQNIRSADTASNLREWAASAWLIHRTGPAMTVGAGLTAGYLDIEDRANMSYGQIQGRVSFDVSEKVTWAVRAGYERRSFLSSDADSLDKPLLGTSVIYRPLPTTVLSLDYDRSVGNSVFQNRVTETDSFGIQLNQRLLGRFNLSVSYQRREIDFVVNELDPIPRDDRIDAFTLSVGTPIARRLTGSVLYRYTQNDTTRPEYAYESDQVGVELRYGF